MALLRQYDDAVTIIKRTLVGDCFKQLNQVGEYVFDAAIRDDSLQVLRFKNGSNYLYTMWAVETYTIVNNRPVYTERKLTYPITNSGLRYDLNEDSSGVMKQQPFYGGNIELTSKPVFIVTSTILPVKDPVKRPDKPTIPEWFHMEVYNSIGQLIKTGYTDNIRAFKDRLPKKQFFIVKYYNDKHNYFEKFYKQ
jgi:hypothetical protein